VLYLVFADSSNIENQSIVLFYDEQRTSTHSGLQRHTSSAVNT